MLLLPLVDRRVGRRAGSAVPVLAVGGGRAGGWPGPGTGRRPPSPYLGRAADIVDALCLVSVVPIAAAVLGLYATMRGLSG